MSANHTTPDKVEEILGSQNYDGTTKLKPFIDMARLLMRRVLTCASARGVSITADEQEMMERLLAADNYCGTVDPLYTSRSTDSASGSFKWNGQDVGPYALKAMQVDPSGCLSKVLSGKPAGFTWLGKTPSERTPYEQRD